MSRALQALGIQPFSLDGLRVTDRETRDVALMVLGGMLNKQLASAINAKGAAAIGLCGSDLQICTARKKVTLHDLGFVGEVDSVQQKWVELFWANGCVPVLASLAPDARGEIYNVNADEMASGIAAACNADFLVFLTDVAGVKDASGCVLSRLTLTEIDELKSSGAVAGGMLPKLESCRKALLQGVRNVRILPATKIEVLKDMQDMPQECGTELVAHA